MVRQQRNFHRFGSVSANFKTRIAIWTPSNELRRMLGQPELTLTFSWYERNGARIFVPQQDTVAWAHRIGIEIDVLSDRAEHDLKQTYRTDRFLTQRALATNAAIKRQFKTRNDLAVKGRNQAICERKHVLPETVIHALKTLGVSKNITGFMKVGQEAAAELGWSTPTYHDRIVAALWKTAGVLGNNESLIGNAQQTVRESLYVVPDLDDCIDEYTLNEISTRLPNALYNRMNDNEKDFNRRVFGASNSFVSQLCLRQHLSHSLKRDTVHRVMSNLTWEALRHEAHCTAIGMLAFVRTMKPELNDAEEELFARKFRPKKHWGGLTLWQLRPRFALLTPFLLTILEGTELEYQSVVPTALRVLQSYSQMVRLRREVDRVRKRPAEFPDAGLDRVVDSKFRRGGKAKRPRLIDESFD